jgi:hypothetical protein
MIIKLFYFFLILAYCSALNAQVFQKPIGCYAGTNGTNVTAMAHPDSRGVLLTDSWENVEATQGVYDFSALIAKINTVKAAGLKYSLAIGTGGYGSPNWLKDSLNADYIVFQSQSGPHNLFFWWDSVIQNRLSLLITQLGINFSQDSSLSHIYISQVTVNGVEGHLNGVDMDTLISYGYTDQKWIDAAKITVYNFANAFPNIPLIFEVHEINHDTVVPAQIMNDLYANANLCGRVGLAMWWISGKTDYQPNMITYIKNFKGDKYAQIIGRSDQTYRFKDSLYANVFIQAKTLGFRYIEPWPYEFQYHTYDSLFNDFNNWTDTTFSVYDTCQLNTTGINKAKEAERNLTIYPNPFDFSTTITTGNPDVKIISISIFNSQGKLILTKTPNNYSFTLTDSKIPSGIYLFQLKLNNNETINKRVFSY